MCEDKIFSAFTQKPANLLSSRLTLALVAVGIFAVAALLPAHQPAQAAVNAQINFQGRLLNAGGAVVADGTYNMEFQVWQGGNGCVTGCSSANAAANNGGTLKWTEDWVYGSGSPDNRVTVKNGYFSVQLGALTSLSAVDFTQGTLWLSMNVGNTTTAATFGAASGDGYMIPFRRMTAAPYALQAANADALAGIAAANYLQLGTAATAAGLQSDASNNISLGVNKTSSTGAIFELQRGGSDVMLVNNAGNVVFQQTALSTSAFTINNSSGNSIFTVDTTDSRIGINLGSGAPTLASSGLELNGALRIDGNTTDNFTTPLGATIHTKINIPVASFIPGPFEQVVALGVSAAADFRARVLTVLDGRTGTHQPSIAVLSPDENDILGFAWEGTGPYTPTVSTSKGSLALQANSLDVLTATNSSGTARVGVGTAPSYPLDVAGDINSSTALRIAGTLVCTVSGCTASSSSGILNQTGVQTGANFNIDGTGVAGTAFQSPLFDTATATTLAIGTTHATAINLNQATTIAANKTLTVDGDTLVKDATNSTSSFQIQPAASTTPVLDVDTSNSRVGIGIAAPTQALDVVGSAKLSSGLFVGSKIVLNTTSVSDGRLSKQALAGAGGVSANDVVVMNSSAAVVDSTTARDIRVYGVAAAAASSGSGLEVVIAGNFQVTADTGAVNVGDQLVTSSTSAQATVDNTATAGIIGVALSAKAGGSSGLVSLAVGAVRGVTNPTFTGNLTVNGTYNTNTFSASALQFGAGSTATIQSAASQALTLTSNAAATWSTSAGNLTVQAAGTNTLALDTAGAGTVSVGSTNAATINVGAGTTAHTIHIGDGAAANTITLGSTNTTSATIIQGGSGGISIGDTATTTSIDIGGVANNGTDTINLATNATNADTIAIGNANAGSTASIQGGGGATAVSIQSAASGTIAIGTANAANTVQIGNTANAIAQTINIGNNATASSANTVAIGSTVGTSTTTIQGGTGNINLITNSSSASIIAKSSTNGTAAFVVQNTSSAAFLTVDTTNERVIAGPSGGDSVGAILVLGDKTNNDTDPTGVAGAMYFNATLQRMRCFYDSQWNYCNDPQSLAYGFNDYEDFITGAGNNVYGVGWLDGSANGGGLAPLTPDVAYRPGQVQVSDGASAGGSGAIWQTGALSAGGAAQFYIGGGETIDYSIKIPTLATATNDYTLYLGLCDSQTGDCANGYYLEYDRATSLNWLFATAKGSTRTKTTSTTAVTTGWHRLKIIANAAGTSLTYSVDGTSLGSISTNIPTATANATEPSFSIIRKAGASEAFVLDYFQYRNSLSQANGDHAPR